MTDLLGHLCWYTVTTGRDGPTNLDITPEDLEAWFAELNLDPAFLPKQMRSVDAFKVATSGRTTEYASEGLRYKLLIVEHGKNADLIQRIVYREDAREGGLDLRDALGEEGDLTEAGLDVEDPAANTPSPRVKVADITYYRPRRRETGLVHGSEDVKYRLHAKLGSAEKREVQTFIDDCLKQYEVNRKSLTPTRMRWLLREYLIFKGAVPIKDGLYFIPPGALQTILGIRNLTARMGEKCRMTLVPLIDTDEQRQMIREAVDNDVEERARGLLGTIANWLESHPNKVPTPRLMGNWRDESRGLQALLVDYAERWDLAFPAAADALEELQALVGQLASRFARSQMWS